MKLYTDDEINSILERFGKVKLDPLDKRVAYDWLGVIQTVARLMDEFLQKYEKPQKTMFLGLFDFGNGDEE